VQHRLPGSITPANKDTNAVIPDLIPHPDFPWIPAFAGMTNIILLLQ
jgi:hypothetical protein